MKKGFILFTALFLLSTFTAFAAVTAVKNGDVVKVTWTYENANAASVGLVGDFQSWNLAGALPMTKGADGVWSITMDGRADSEYSYKFNVDGEWTEDPKAPNTVDDGFGGLNGKVIVADVLATSAGLALAPKAGFTFSNYTSLRVLAYNKSLTYDSNGADPGGVENVTNYEKARNGGFIGDKDKIGVDFAVKSYWKILDAKLWENISLKKVEFAVDNKFINIYDSAREDMPVQATGLVAWALAPFNTNGGFSPYNGHFSVAVGTPIGEIASYYHYAKAPTYAKYYFLSYGQVDALGGLTQLKGDKIAVADGVTIDYLVGIGSNGRTGMKDGTVSWPDAPVNGSWWDGAAGYYGTKSYLDVSVAGQEFGVMVNTTSAVNGHQDIMEMFKDFSTELGLGAQGKVGDLSYGVQLINHFYDAGDVVNKQYSFDLHHILGAKVTYKMGGLTTKFDFADKGSQIEGNLFQQNADDAKDDGDDLPAYANFDGGISYISLSNLYTGDTFTAGLDLDGQLNSILAEAPATKTTKVSSTLYGSFNVSSDITVGAHIFQDVSVADPAPVGGTASNFRGVGVYSILKNVGVPKITVGARVDMNNANTEATTDDYLNTSLLAQLDLADAMNLSLGFTLLGGEANSNNENNFGLGLGFAKKFDGNGFRGPQFYTNIAFNMDMFTTLDEKYALDMSKDIYLDQGDVAATNKTKAGAWWAVATGFKWDF